jgi:hypothetical protein
MYYGMNYSAVASPNGRVFAGFAGNIHLANMQHSATTRLHTIIGHIAPSVDGMATIQQSATHNVEKQTTISSHVLDTQSGKPASGLRLKLHIKDGQGTIITDIVLECWPN